MMENEKIKKVNMVYLLGYIFIPMIICAICFILSYLFFPKGNGAVILIMGPSILSALWWIFGNTLIYKNKNKRFLSELDQTGFTRNHTFYGDNSIVVVDIENGEIAILFSWNPFVTYRLPANRVTKAWVDDGRGGKGFLEGSSRVSFLMIIDDIKIQVNTFTSNQRWKMDSDYILTGISKADKMVEVINLAQKKAK